MYEGLRKGSRVRWVVVIQTYASVTTSGVRISSAELVEILSDNPPPVYFIVKSRVTTRLELFCTFGAMGPGLAGLRMRFV